MQKLRLVLAHFRFKGGGGQLNKAIFGPYIELVGSEWCNKASFNSEQQITNKRVSEPARKVYDKLSIFVDH